MYVDYLTLACLRDRLDGLRIDEVRDGLADSGGRGCDGTALYAARARWSPWTSHLSKRANGLGGGENVRLPSVPISLLFLDLCGCLLNLLPGLTHVARLGMGLTDT